MKSIHTICLLLTLLVLVTHSSQDIEIPMREYGFTIGDPTGSLHLQFVLDFQCPDSKDQHVIWNTVRKTMGLYENHIKFTYQFNPLPYHFFAIKIHQGFFYILEHAGQRGAEDYIDYVFDNQDKFSQENNINKTMSEFSDEFAQEIASQFGVDIGGLRTALNLGSPEFQSLRVHWKYTAGVLGVPGAPIFLANGVKIDGAQNFNESDWVNFINKFKLKENKLIRSY